MTLREHNLYPLFFQEIKSHFGNGVDTPWSQIPATKHQFLWQMSRCRTIYCDSVSTFSSHRLRGSIQWLGGRSAQVKSLSKHETIKMTDPWKPINLYQSLKAAQKFHQNEITLRTWPKCSLLLPHRISSLFTSRLVVSNPIAPKGEGSFYAESQQFLP